MKRPPQTVPTPSREIKGTRDTLDRRDPVIKGHRIVDGKLSEQTQVTARLAGGAPVNSQQLDVDWSKFENHTFFDSAVGKVNAAFVKIINEFPFDSSEEEINKFIDEMTGFEKYVYDLFPKSVGYLTADGSAYISVLDQTGASFPDQSRDSTGNEVIAPNGSDFTVQMHLSPQAAQNRVQVVAQYRQDQETGFTLFLSHSESTASTSLVFAVGSGSFASTVSAPIKKGQFQHVSAQYSRNATTASLSLFVNAVQSATSSNVIRIGDNFRAPALTIFSGSSFFEGTSSQTPGQLYAGSIDDFRIYRTLRSPDEVRTDAILPDYSSDSLTLYYKFNEPPGGYSQSSVVLDSSGNSLHAKIQNYSSSMRTTGSSALSIEPERVNPVLFPDFDRTAFINSQLLATGSIYDDENPNYILRLVPQHYFNEAQAQFGFSEVQGDLGSSYTGQSIPGSGGLGSIQIMTAMLLIYAKAFDEIKVFHDHFARLTYVDYNETESVSNQFLSFLSGYYGFDLPNLFQESSVDHYVYGTGLSSTETMSLKQVQDNIFRRILTNMREIVTSKGTQSSIKSLLNAAGIAPNTFFRIREYGGPTSVRIETQREEVTEVSSLLHFSGSIAPVTPTLTSDGFSTNLPHVVGSFLSGSRIESGYPAIGGQFVNATELLPHGVSNSVNDGLLTSGSWSIEGVFRITGSDVGVQSLMRLHTTGTSAPCATGGVILNVVATQNPKTVNAYFAVDSAKTVQPLAMHITGADIFDGNRWHVSFTRRRPDDNRAPQLSLYDRTAEYTRSQYTLTCQRAGLSGDLTVFSASAFFDESSAASSSVLETISAQYNASGAFLVIGSQSLARDAAYAFLNDSSIDSEIHTTQFAGKVGQVRFWSYCLDKDELLEHARSNRSLGVQDPIVNFGFASTTTGSFEKLRMDLSMDQPVTGTDASGAIQIFDFSQTGRHASGTGFESTKLVLKPDPVAFTQVSTRFDVRQTNEKVRIRSLTEADNLELFPDALPAPIYEQQRSEPTVSDPRIAIEASAVDALNDDIVKLLSSLDFFDRALGDPRVLNEDHYPQLEALRRVYFNRLTDKPDLKAMYEVFNWVSKSLGELIAQLIPMNSVYLGIAYIVESHVAERSRVKYSFDKRYLMPSSAVRSDSTDCSNAVPSQDLVAGTSFSSNRSSR